MLILGIDPGTARTGVGIVSIKTKTPKFVYSDVIITHQDLEMPKRLRLLYKTLSAVIKEYAPDIMVVERLFFNTNVKTAIAVGQARGIALLSAADKNLPVFEYTALQAKLALTGYGRSSKKEVQEAVKDILKLDIQVKSDDANDAVAMALCFIRKDLEQYLDPSKIIIK